MEKISLDRNTLDKFCKNICRHRNVLYFIPIPLLFTAVVWYIVNSSLDVPALNDYIREINAYVGPGKIQSVVFSKKLFTTAQLGLLMRWINIDFLGYSVYFQIIIGAVGLAFIAIVMYRYAIRHNLNFVFYGVILLCIFSLNKWEMILNGTGAEHFWSFAAFYLYFLYIDKWYVTKEHNRRNKFVMILLPVVTILGLAVFYSAIFAIVANLLFAAIIIKRIRRAEELKYEIVFLLSVDVPMAVYLVFRTANNVSNLVTDGSFLQNFCADPVYFVKFFIASFSSELIGVETVLNLSNGMTAAYLSGLLVIAMYMISVYFNIKYRIDQLSLMPVILLVSGILNHMIVLYSRWGFHSVTYGMSSRYELQYLEGLLGIVLTLFFVYRYHWSVYKSIALVPVVAIFLLGSELTNRDEIIKMPYRMKVFESIQEVCLTYDRYSDEELGNIFVTDGKSARKELELLKQYKLSVWKYVEE